MTAAFFRCNGTRTRTACAGGVGVCFRFRAAFFDTAALRAAFFTVFFLAVFWTGFGVRVRRGEEAFTALVFFTLFRPGFFAFFADFFVFLSAFFFAAFLVDFFLAGAGRAAFFFETFRFFTLALFFLDWPGFFLAMNIPSFCNLARRASRPGIPIRRAGPAEATYPGCAKVAFLSSAEGARRHFQLPLIRDWSKRGLRVYA